jgi:hypothetical protein
MYLCSNGVYKFSCDTVGLDFDPLDGNDLIELRSKSLVASQPRDHSDLISYWDLLVGGYLRAVRSHTSSLSAKGAISGSALCPVANR